MNIPLYSSHCCVDSECFVVFSLQRYEIFIKSNSSLGDLFNKDNCLDDADYFNCIWDACKIECRKMIGRNKVWGWEWRTSDKWKKSCGFSYILFHFDLYWEWGLVCVWWPPVHCHLQLSKGSSHHFFVKYRIMKKTLNIG